MSRKHAGSSGFTLVELLVVIALMGMLAAALSIAVVAVLRTNPQNSDRVDDARLLQGLTAWLPQDVDSTPSGSFDTDRSKTPACDGYVDDGVNLLHLTWTEHITSTRTFVAAYRLVDDGDSSRILRITCDAPGVTAPFGTARSMTVSGLIESRPDDWDPGEMPAVVLVEEVLEGEGDDATVVGTKVSIGVRSVNGKEVWIEAASKNPAAFFVPPPTLAPPEVTTTTSTTTTTTTTLPPPPSSSSTSSTSSTTTTTTTTTTLPVFCNVTNLSVTGSVVVTGDGRVHAAVNSNGNGAVGQLVGNVEVNVGLDGSCAGMVLRYPTELKPGNPPPGTGQLNFSVGASAALAQLNTNAGSTWYGTNSGTPHLLEVVVNGDVKATTNLYIHAKNQMP
jgi:prepilin-type N-terminal cleavage/methylation domain-containing protein